MNFLAHAFLSGGDEQVLLGNFVADSVKGRMIENYGTDFRNGVLLHRAIDQYTDNHELVQECNVRLRPYFRKFAGVVTDIYFDHFLARHWDTYSTTPLRQFVEKVYRLLEAHCRQLPPRSQRIIPWMVTQDWLAGYAGFESLHRNFVNMSQRTRFHSGMENAVGVLQQEYDFLENRFQKFFPSLMAFADEYRDNFAPKIEDSRDSQLRREF